LDFASNSFDTVASCECFEHNPEWAKTFENMHRMCKPEWLGIFFLRHNRKARAWYAKDNPC
jgi:2-polyprenyl-3-methyl-5-hydroxy-6-metoxy-1,4-benzoquinol methylase